MSNKNQIIEILSRPGARLPSMIEWLREIWSLANFRSRTPVEYLQEGESKVHRAEELVLSSAFTLYDELEIAAENNNLLREAFDQQTPIAVVLLDGLSLREIPILELLAEQTGFDVLEVKHSFAALPSETEDFIEQHLLGKRIAPSQLPGRKELTDQCIGTLYYDAPHRIHPLPESAKHLLLWSQFPDGTYKDSGARFVSHFAEMRKSFDVVWKNIVMQIPREYKIILTSDHGYIFFGQELESTFPGEGVRHLNGDRYKFFTSNEVMPQYCQDLHIMNGKRLAVLRGRIKNRPQGPSGNKVYRHGGMSIMEMITPWIVLQRR